MFTQEERQAIYDFLKEVHGYSPAYVRMRVMEFVRAMGTLRNVKADFIIEFSKWLNIKFCKNESEDPIRLLTGNMENNAFSCKFGEEDYSVIVFDYPQTGVLNIEFK
jgi:hypothetical protein